MTKCRDCLHVDICEHFANTLNQRLIHYCEIHIPFEKEVIHSEPCEYFKDRSRSADLPCKVGDYLYRPDRFGIGKYLVVGIQLLKSNRIDIAWKLLDGVGIPIPYISAEDIGKTVFLTREEAEITLEEWKHDGKL